MRYRPEQKTKTRQKILETASRQFKEKGYTGAGLGDLMKAADRTVGGFYAHFESKEDLLAQVVETALDENTQLLFSGLDEVQGEDWLKQVVRRYLSRLHRDSVAEGCPAPALAPEIARAAPEVRQAFQRALLRCLGPMAAQSPPLNGCDPQQRALATMSLMLGGLLLARAVPDPELSDRILKSCRLFAGPPEGVQP